MGQDIRAAHRLLCLSGTGMSSCQETILHIRDGGSSSLPLILSPDPHQSRKTERVLGKLVLGGGDGEMHEGNETISIILLEEVFYFNKGTFVYLLGISPVRWPKGGHRSSFPPESFRT